MLDGEQLPRELVQVARELSSQARALSQKTEALTDVLALIAAGNADARQVAELLATSGAAPAASSAAPIDARAHATHDPTRGPLPTPTLAPPRHGADSERSRDVEGADDPSNASLAQGGVDGADGPSDGRIPTAKRRLEPIARSLTALDWRERAAPEETRAQIAAARGIQRIVRGGQLRSRVTADASLALGEIDRELATIASEAKASTYSRLRTKTLEAERARQEGILASGARLEALRHARREGRTRERRVSVGDIAEVAVGLKQVSQARRRNEMASRMHSLHRSLLASVETGWNSSLRRNHDAKVRGHVQSGAWAPPLLSCESGYASAWSIHISVVTMIVFVTMPVELAWGKATMGWLHSWEAKWLIDVSYVLDLFIIFNTTYIDPDTQIEVWSRRQVARRYVTNWRLRDGSWVPVDLLSSVPLKFWDWLAEVYHPHSARGKLFKFLGFARLVRLVNVSHLARWHKAKKNVTSEFVNPVVIRLLEMCFSLLLIWHLLACWYWSIVRVSVEDDDDSEWLPVAYDFGGEFDQYMTALYWSVRAVAGEINGDPETNYQKAFSMLSLVTGLMIGGYIIASITNLVTNMDHEARTWQSETEKTVSYMRRQGVPVSTIRKVVSYFDYIWASCSRNKVVGTPELIKKLPPLLQAEVHVFLSKRVIDEIPILEMCTTSEAQFALVRGLHSEVVLPDQVICCEGEFGDCMFFLMRGEVCLSALRPDGSAATICVLEVPGEFFGENVMFDSESKRLATATSARFAELMKLDSEVFFEVVEKEPDVHALLRQTAQERSRAKKQAVRSKAQTAGEESKHCVTVCCELFTRAVQTLDEKYRRATGRVQPGNNRNALMQNMAATAHHHSFRLRRQSSHGSFSPPKDAKAAVPRSSSHAASRGRSFSPPRPQSESPPG